MLRDLDLPIVEVVDEIINELKNNNTLLLHAPPGAGKSTLVPLTLLDQTWLKGKKILMLEPRRLAARTIALRMADILGEKPGKTIGYRIRFETCVSEQTKIEVVTEGILTKMIQSDNSLDDVGLVIFDEFHERSLHADLAMAFCREVQSVLREDLRILVMSATLDMPHLIKMLKCPAVTSNGRQYPVDIHHVGDQDETLLPEMTARTIANATKKHDGDVLVFLPGQGEIRKCEEILRKQLKAFQIHPLFGLLPANRQYAAIMPDKQGRRKIVLSTSIAETSLTIEGVKIVVDSGFGRTSKFDPNSGLSRLQTVQISKDSADQRAGRAGRLSSGVCYRMWTKATHARLKSHRTPEIMEADLASLVLEMAQWGINDPMQLTWTTPPPIGTIAQASDLLHNLNALDRGKITEHGKAMHALPCHPRIAHMLILAKEDDLLPLATDIAALMEERDPLGKEAGININLRIEALRKFRREKSLNKRLSRIERIAAQYRAMQGIEEDNELFDEYETGILLTYAYPERIACNRPGNNAQFQLANGKIAMAGHKDDLAHEQWLAVSHVDARDGMGKIFMASPLNPKDLAPLVKEMEVVKWDTELGGLIATMDLRIGNIVLKSTPLPDPDEALLKQAISEAIAKEGERLLNFDDKVAQWQNRIISLKKWTNDDWPDVSTRTLLLKNKEWITPYLDKIKKPEDLKKLDLSTILESSLSWEQQEQLNQMTPTKIKVPSGSSIGLHYRNDGEPPILAVRIQEVFGMPSTPKINNGNQPVILHLLSPGYKPVQVTSDLENFWNNTYFEVRKELKRRYPKHVWPDDPWTEPAIRGVKRRQ
ncbi:MAG: ATP-dependent helicase HrpB [Cyclobacteriaceae bacterium]